MKYLRFIIKAGVELRINPEKIKAIWEWKLLNIKKKVRTFLSFANYYKAFINKFIITVAFFTALIGKHLFFLTAKA